MKLPESWREVRLSDVLWRVETKVDPQTSIALEHFYIGLEHVESHTGRLLRETEDVTEGRDILSIKTAFQAGDILYGKLRPNLNKVHLAAQDGICSTDIWALRATGEILPEFAAHYLRSPVIHIRASQIAAGANLPRVPADSFDRISFPLPTLPEQQRIVDVLRQAERISHSQAQRDKILESILKAELDRLVLKIDEAEWVQLGDLVETRYGTSVSAEESGEHGLPVLRIPNVVGGEVDMGDMKFVSLSDAEIDRLRLNTSDVLIVRSNGNPNYVGRSAPITEDLAQWTLVYASYLIRLRANTDRLLSEYLSAFLNSPFGRAAMRNAIRTTAGQSNLSGENLLKVRIPLPSMPDQRHFRKVWSEVRQLRQLRRESESKRYELIQHLTVQALSGELTTEWRDQHREEIATAAQTRDALLRERGAKLALQPPEPALPPPRGDAERTLRHWLLSELSDFQRAVLAGFLAYDGHPLLAEVPDEFDRFRESDTLGKHLATFPPPSPNPLRRTLSQLAALGLIAKISLPRTHPTTREQEFLTAFRPLRPEEHSRVTDIALLRRALGIELSLLKHYFQVSLDFETSERAGASGMFQVITVTDDTGKDRTGIVDQGKHYGSQEELAADIAQELGVSTGQVILEKV